MSAVFDEHQPAAKTDSAHYAGDGQAADQRAAQVNVVLSADAAEGSESDSSDQHNPTNWIRSNR
jgi:hypothetical protein